MPRRSPKSRLVRLAVFVITALAVATGRYVVAEPGVDVRFHAAGQFTSDDFRVLQLRLRLLASIGYAGDVVGGSLRCSTLPGGLPCPAATGKVDIQSGEFVPGPSPNFRYPITFGDGATCSLTGFVPYAVSFIAAFRPPISPPFVILETPASSGWPFAFCYFPTTVLILHGLTVIVQMANCWTRKPASANSGTPKLISTGSSRSSPPTLPGRRR